MLAEGPGLLLLLGFLRALVLLCQGRARGREARQAETGPLFPLTAWDQGWGSPWALAGGWAWAG